jgi:hypothetical protein
LCFGVVQLNGHIFFIHIQQHPFDACEALITAHIDMLWYFMANLSGIFDSSLSVGMGSAFAKELLPIQQ